MQATVDDIHESCSASLTEAFGCPVEFAPGLPPSNCSDLTWSRVLSHGSWEGEIRVGCNQSLLTREGARMFGLEPDAVTDQDRADVNAELVNILAGNLLPLFGTGGSITLPEPSDASGNPEATTLSFAIEDGWLVLQLDDAA